MNAFLGVNVTFHDTVIMIHDVIITGNPFLYNITASLCLSVLKIIKLKKSDVER